MADRRLRATKIPPTTATSANAPPPAAKSIMRLPPLTPSAFEPPGPSTPGSSVWFFLASSGSTRVPTGLTLPSAAKPQSSSPVATFQSDGECISAMMIVCPLRRAAPTKV